MSLINDVLRDLSRRSPDMSWLEPGDEVQAVAAPPVDRKRSPRRLLLPLLLVAAFAALSLLLDEPQNGQEREAPVPVVHPAIIAAASAQPPPTARSAAAGLFRMDWSLRNPLPAEAAAREMPARRRVPAPASPSPSPSMAEEARRPVAPRANAEQLLEEARSAQALGRADEAERLYRQLLADGLDHPRARAQLAALLMDQGRLDEAEPLLQAGLADTPASPAYRRLAAQLALLRGQDERALERLLSGPVPALPAAPEFHAVLAAAYQRLNRHTEAAELYRHLTQLRPEEAAWWVGYAISLEAVGAKDQSLVAYLRARQNGSLHPSLVAYAASRSAALREELGR